MAAAPLRPTYDVVMVSDFRFPGGTSASLATEIRAQAAAGYTTALVQVPAPVLKTQRPFNDKVRSCIEEGLADLVLTGTPLHARLLVVRHPVVFEVQPSTPPDITSDRRLMVVNQVPSDGSQEEGFYDVAAVQNVVRDVFGGDFLWTPIGPLVRDSFREHGGPVELVDWTWHNILNVDDWAAPRTAPTSDRPVIGRHSRPHWRKWPVSAEEILAAYPDDPRFEVRILGGDKVPRQILGQVPSNWTIYPFNSMSATDFLKQIDYFVYYHHPGLKEAFGRAVLEAIASGAVSIVGRHFEPLFGGSCIYAEPHEVQDIVLRLHADRTAFDEQSHRARAFVDEHFSFGTHQRRVAGLIGEPSNPPQPHRAPAAPRSRVLYVSREGGGAGHLTRLLALAAQPSEAVHPMFLSLSPSFDVLRTSGHAVEYFAPRSASDVGTTTWNTLLAARLAELARTYDPSVVVIEGQRPPAGLLDARRQLNGVSYVWLRPALRRPLLPGQDAVDDGAFDLVIEPWDLAAPDFAQTPGALRVGPLGTPTKAPGPLALPSKNAPVALVHLAANDLEVRADATRRAARTLSEGAELTVCVPRSPGEPPLVGLPSDTVQLEVAAVEELFHQVSVAVVAATSSALGGLLSRGVPTLFVPFLDADRPEQRTRGQAAAERGAAIWIEEEATDDQLSDAVARLLDPRTREELAIAGPKLVPQDGAAAAAAAIEALARRRGR